MIAAATVVVLLAAATGAGIWLTRSHHPEGRASATAPVPGHSTAAGSPNAVSQSPVPSASSSPVTPSPVPSPSTAAPTPSATAPSNTVTLSPNAAADPQSQSVVTFLGQYFTAINGHDFLGYRNLLGAQLRAAMTRQKFNTGYRSTVDFGERLRRISSDASGDTVATITFTSHQNPADSVNGRQSCTRWRISLFLQTAADGYVIEQAPAGYHSSYSACR